jgi:hypothetical protein
MQETARLPIAQITGNPMQESFPLPRPRGYWSKCFNHCTDQSLGSGYVHTVNVGRWRARSKPRRRSIGQQTGAYLRGARNHNRTDRSFEYWSTLGMLPAALSAVKGMLRERSNKIELKPSVILGLAENCAHLKSLWISRLATRNLWKGNLAAYKQKKTERGRELRSLEKHELHKIISEDHRQSLTSLNDFSLFVWLVADWCWFVLREKYCWLVAGLLWEKSTAGWWQISQANRLNQTENPASRTCRSKSFL